MKKITVFFLAATMIAGTGYAKGDKLEGVSKDEFKKLKDLGLVKEYDSAADGAEVDTSDCGVLEEKVTALEGEKSTLEEKVTALEGEKSTLEEKVTALENAQAEIAKLTGFVKAAIELPKGQKPAGFEG